MTNKIEKKTAHKSHTHHDELSVKKKMCDSNHSSGIKSEYGAYVFIAGLIIAIVSSFFTLSIGVNKIVLAVLIILGLVIGILNITGKEAIGFMIASVVFVILLGPFLGLIGQNFIQSEFINRFFGSLIAFIVPAAIIVALKTIIVTARDED